MNTHLLRNAVVILCTITAPVTTVLAQNTSSTYTGISGGFWGSPTSWTPAIVPNNSGSATFDVAIPSKAVNLNLDVTINSLTFSGANPRLNVTDHNFTSAASSIGLLHRFNVTATTADTSASLGNLADFSGTTLNGGSYYLVGNAGRTATLRFNGAHIMTNASALHLQGAGTLRILDENGTDALRDFNHNGLPGTLEVTNGASYAIANSFVNEGIINVGGTLTFAGDLTQIGDRREPGTQGYIQYFPNGSVIINGTLTNYDAATKTLRRGRYNVEAAGTDVSTLQVVGGALFDIVNNDASIALVAPGAAMLDRDGANALRNLAVNNRALRLVNHDFTTAGSFINSDDPISLLAFRQNSHFTVSGALQSLGGILEISPLGLGDINGTPMSAELNVNGTFTLAPAAKLRFEVFGPAATSTVLVTGNTALNGAALEVLMLPSAPIMTSGSLTLLTSNTITGAFSNVASGGRVSAYAINAFNGPHGNYDGVIAGTFKADYTGGSLVISDFQPHASVLNISTRLKVQTGDNVLIGGFIVRGIGPKKMIVRGMGPSLSANGVPGALQDPMLELHDSTGAIILSNDNWQDTQASEIQATGIAPGDPRESAIVATLEPGSYTAVMRGGNNTIGVGLVEAYDLDVQPGMSELVNISTRGRVETADNVMIGGYIVGAAEPAKLIVRGIGPSLAVSNVPGSLQDPTLELHNASGATIMSNDNWQDDATQAALIQSAGLAPADPRESALAATLNPGSYTAIVRGKNETQGVALVEFYKLN